MMLYEDNRAPNPRRLRIFLAEKGIEVPRTQLDLMSEQHKSPDMVKRNPFMRLPVLELDDGRCLSEAAAICRYFEALQPEPPLMGRDAFDVAWVEMWQRRIEHYLMAPIAAAFRHSHPRMAHLEVPQVKAWAEANVPRIEAMLAFLDGELAERPYIAGETFTIADIDALCAVDFMRLARVQVRDDQTALRRWHDRVAARPSAQA